MKNKEKLKTIADVEKWIAEMLFSENGFRPMLAKAKKEGDAVGQMCYQYGFVLLSALLDLLDTKGNKKDA